MTTYYAATTESGAVFTRSTKGRKYTHMVVAVNSFAANRAQAEAGARCDWKMNHAYHMGFKDGTSNFLKRPTYLMGALAKRHSTDPRGDETQDQRDAAVAEWETRKAQEIISAKKWLAMGEQGHVCEALARATDFERRMRATDMVTPDGEGWYSDAGWCGRPDLAMKLCDSTRAKNRSALMLEAVEVTAIQYRKLKGGK